MFAEQGKKGRNGRIFSVIIENEPKFCDKSLFLCMMYKNGKIISILKEAKVQKKSPIS